MTPDNQSRYGTVSRVLHWGMAVLFLWQLMSSAAHYFLEDTAIEAFFWPTHKPLGFLLLVLVFIRLIWAVINLAKRPPSLTKAAAAGHLALYGFMFIVPSLALLRQYGAGRAFEPFGLPVFSGFEGEKIKWMIDLGSDFHGELGWAFFAVIIGHISMAVWHKFKDTEQDVLPRMYK